MRYTFYQRETNPSLKRSASQLAFPAQQNEAECYEYTGVSLIEE